MTDHDPPSPESPAFNLIDEPWIPVVDLNGIESEVSIRDALVNSHQIRDITGELPSVRFALLRVLLAIIYRAFDEEADDPMTFWGELWKDDTLPSDLIDPYLEQWRHRFNLVSPIEPFMQVPDLRTAKDEWKTVDLIVADVELNGPLFTMRSQLDHLSFPESARWLVHVNAYDISGIKSGAVGDSRVKGGKGYPMGIGWCGWLGGIALTGRTLRETLLLNYIAGLTDDLPDDVPVWEQPVLPTGERESRQIGEVGPIALLTWPQRRVRLRTEGDAVTGALVTNGDPVPYTTLWTTETMSGWRFSEPQSSKAKSVRYMPRTFSPGEALWRGLRTLIPHGDSSRLDEKSREKWNVEEAARPAAVIEWLGRLMKQRYIDPDYVVEVSSVSMEYGPQMSSYTEVISDRLSFAAALADLADHAGLLELAQTAVDQTDKAVRALGYFSRDLDKAAGGDGGDGVSESVSERAYAEFDQSFRRWLLRVKPGCDGEALLEDWIQGVRRSVQRRAEDLVKSAPSSAWIGRDKGGNVLTIPSALNKFDRSLYFALGASQSKEQEDTDE